MTFIEKLWRPFHNPKDLFPFQQNFISNTSQSRWANCWTHTHTNAFQLIRKCAECVCWRAQTIANGRAYTQKPNQEFALVAITNKSYHLRILVVVSLVRTICSISYAFDKCFGACFIGCGHKYAYLYYIKMITKLSLPWLSKPEQI